MAKVPLISVIIPAYNQEKFIGRCLRSLLSQTLPKDQYEIIVVNDGSKDKTAFALHLFKEEIRIIKLDDNGGLPAALNAGIRESKGRYVIRVDADDYVHGEYLNIMSLHLNMNEYMDAVACDYQLVDDNEQVIRVVDCMKEPIGCGIMFRMGHLIDLGFYDEDMRFHEDKDLRYRFLEKYKIHRVTLPLYRYRRHDKNMTNNVEKMNMYSKKLEEKHKE